jgi:hypothetical protein
MSIRVDTSILNQNGTPAFNANAYAFRPPAGYIGRIFISTDSKQIFRDTGSAWDLISDAGSGSSNLQEVTANGNYTPYGINITSGGLYLLGSVNGGIFFADGGSGQFTQDATTLFWDNTNKRLGINTASPSAKLDVHSGSGTNVTFNGTGVTNAVATFQSAGTSKWSLGNYVSSAVANDFCIYDNVNGSYRLYVHNTGVINIPSSLIIGSSTPTSSYTFDVTGSGKFSSTLTLGTILQGSVLFAGSGGLVNQNNSNFFWDNTNNRLGINQSTPLYSLDVTGTGRFTSNVGIGSVLSTWGSPFNNAVLQLGTGGGFIVGRNDAFNQLQIGSNATYDGTNWLYKSTDFASKYYQAQGTHIFQYAPSGTAGATITWNTAMTITTGGNVLIGTTTDGGQKFQVSGTSYFSGNLTSGGNLIATNALQTTITAGGNYQLYVPASTNFTLYNSNVGNIGSFNYTTGIYTPVSDINRKKDLEASTIGLDAILGLKPTLYRMTTENNTKKHLGFIAQEVKEFIPQAYTEDKDFIGLSDRPIIAALVKAIQELNEKLIRNNIN